MLRAAARKRESVAIRAFPPGFPGEGKGGHLKLDAAVGGDDAAFHDAPTRSSVDDLRWRGGGKRSEGLRDLSISGGEDGAEGQERTSFLGAAPAIAALTEEGDDSASPRGGARLWRSAPDQPRPLDSTDLRGTWGCCRMRFRMRFKDALLIVFFCHFFMLLVSW